MEKQHNGYTAVVHLLAPFVVMRADIKNIHPAEQLSLFKGERCDACTLATLLHSTVPESPSMAGIGASKTRQTSSCCPRPIANAKANAKGTGSAQAKR